MSAAIDKLVDYESSPGDVDENIAAPGYLGVTARGPFEPNTRISDAAQRWIFRMVHSERPLQEKMALFWHNHFATGFSKIAGQLRPGAASRALAAKPSEDADGVKGQLELFREHALGNFRDLLLAVSEDPAMVAWLDGDTNFKAISEFPKWRKYLILLSFLDNSSARPVQIGGVDVNICHSRVDRSPRTPAVQFAIPPRGDHFVAHGRALWKLTGRGRTERAHRAVENAVRFPRASTGPFPSSYPRKTPKGP